MNKKIILLTTLLLTVFVATTILALLTAKKSTTKVHTTSSDSPKLFMKNATYTDFNKQGHINKKIHTTKITHFSNGDNYLFNNPTMVINIPNEQPWHISADKGKSENGKDKVYLWGNVKITRKAGTNNTDFDIKTNELTIHPEIKIASTKDHLTIKQGGNLTKSIGGEVNLKTGVFKLMSQIEGIYQVK